MDTLTGLSFCSYATAKIKSSCRSAAVSLALCEELLDSSYLSRIRTTYIFKRVFLGLWEENVDNGEYDEPVDDRKKGIRPSTDIGKQGCISASLIISISPFSPRILDLVQ